MYLFFLNRYPIMIKCLNILKNIGKPIYRSISTCDPIHSDQAALHSCLCACFQMEFEAQMDQVKSGARLCSLPDICVPSVPSVPALPVRAAAHSVGSLKVKGRRLLISVCVPQAMLPQPSGSQFHGPYVSLPPGRSTPHRQTS